VQLPRTSGRKVSEIARDLGVCESFHATLKKELVHRHRWPTKQAAKTAVFEYVEGWFNPHRRHSTLRYHSPADYESQHALRHT
jgi:putative transposase